MWHSANRHLDPPRPVSEDDNVTSVHLGLVNLVHELPPAWRYMCKPPQCWFDKRNSRDDKDNLPPPLIENGKEVHDPDTGDVVLDWEILPRHISTKEPGMFYEILMCLDPRIKDIDLWHRMSPTHRPGKGLASVGVNYIQMWRRRGRGHWNLLTWDQRKTMTALKKGARPEDNNVPLPGDDKTIWERLSEDQKKKNTTRGLTPGLRDPSLSRDTPGNWVEIKVSTEKEMRFRVCGAFGKGGRTKKPKIPRETKSKSKKGPKKGRTRSETSDDDNTNSKRARKSRASGSRQVTAERPRRRAAQAHKSYKEDDDASSDLPILDAEDEQDMFAPDGEEEDSVEASRDDPARNSSSGEAGHEGGSVMATAVNVSGSVAKSAGKTTQPENARRGGRATRHSMRLGRSVDGNAAVKDESDESGASDGLENQRPMSCKRKHAEDVQESDEEQGREEHVTKRSRMLRSAAKTGQSDSDDYTHSTMSVVDDEASLTSPQDVNGPSALQQACRTRPQTTNSRNRRGPPPASRPAPSNMDERRRIERAATQPPSASADSSSYFEPAVPVYESSLGIGEFPSNKQEWWLAWHAGCGLTTAYRILASMAMNGGRGPLETETDKSFPVEVSDEERRYAEQVIAFVREKEDSKIKERDDIRAEFEGTMDAI